MGLQATIYSSTASDDDDDAGNISCAFLSNTDPKNDSEVVFKGQTYLVPAWSVSILHESKVVMYNTAMVAHQTTVRNITSVSGNIGGAAQQPLTWESYGEPIGARRSRSTGAAAAGTASFTIKGLQDQMNTTRDTSDYLWYTTR